MKSFGAVVRTRDQAPVVQTAVDNPLDKSPSCG